MRILPAPIYPSHSTWWFADCPSGGPAWSVLRRYAGWAASGPTGSTPVSKEVLA